MSQVYECFRRQFETINKCQEQITDVFAALAVCRDATTVCMEQAFHAFPDVEPVVVEDVEKPLGVSDYPACAWPAPGSDVPTEEVAQAFAIPQPASTIVYPDSPQNTGVVSVRYE